MGYTRVAFGSGSYFHREPLSNILVVSKLFKKLELEKNQEIFEFTSKKSIQSISCTQSPYCESLESAFLSVQLYSGSRQKRKVDLLKPLKRKPSIQNFDIKSQEWNDILLTYNDYFVNSLRLKELPKIEVSCCSKPRCVLEVPEKRVSKNFEIGEELADLEEELESVEEVPRKELPRVEVQLCKTQPTKIEKHLEFNPRMEIKEIKLTRKQKELLDSPSKRIPRAPSSGLDKELKNSNKNEVTKKNFTKNVKKSIKQFRNSKQRKVPAKETKRQKEYIDQLLELRYKESNMNCTPEKKHQKKLKTPVSKQVRFATELLTEEFNSEIHNTQIQFYPIKIFVNCEVKECINLVEQLVPPNGYYIVGLELGPGLLDGMHIILSWNSGVQFVNAEVLSCCSLTNEFLESVSISKFETVLLVFLGNSDGRYEGLEVLHDFQKYALQFSVSVHYEVTQSLSSVKTGIENFMNNFTAGIEKENHWSKIQGFLTEELDEISKVLLTTDCFNVYSAMLFSGLCRENCINIQDITSQNKRFVEFLETAEIPLRMKQGVLYFVNN